MQYRHFKGGIYDFVCEAQLESDPQVIMVVYRAKDGTVWTRPKEIFFEQIEIEGKTIPRFSPVI